MKKYIQKKLLGCMNYSLLVIMGSMCNRVYGSQNVTIPGQLTLQQIAKAQTMWAIIRGSSNSYRDNHYFNVYGDRGYLYALWAMDNDKLYRDPYGDTERLRAVRTGDLQMVQFLTGNPYTNFNKMDHNWNTDLMIAMMAQGNSWRPGHPMILNFLIQFKNRNWNSQNKQRETALSLAIKLNQTNVVKTLLQIDEVDPNIPNAEGVTPLIRAIWNSLESLNSVASPTIEIPLLLINNPRTKVNQRGPNNKLPLQVAASLGTQLFDPIIRRSLIDYDVAIKNVTRDFIQQLNPDTEGQVLTVLQDLLNNPITNINDYRRCSINQLINAIRQKIHPIQKKMESSLSNFRGNLTDRLFRESLINKLRAIDTNVQLYNQCWVRRNSESLQEIHSRLVEVN